MTFETVLVVVKAAHAVGIALWSGALLATPGPLMQRPRDSGPDLERVHGMARRLYINWASPAAFVAIGTGVLLMFLCEPSVAPFSLKMLLVSVLLMVHVDAGAVILRVFEPQRRAPGIAGSTLTGVSMVVVVAILGVVLAKPSIDVDAVVELVFAPGS